MLYGYPVRRLTADGLSELREVTFAAPPEVLRQVAAFLGHAAAALEAGGVSPQYHLHIGSVVPGWSARFPDADVIVMPPAESPPAGGANADDPGGHPGS